jgi:formylglycine-generating enzyme required for sulfatase activity
MKSPWLAVFVVAAIAFLPLTQANSGEPDKSPTSAADQMIGKQPGQVRDDNGLKMKFVWCPPGFITMEQVEHPAAGNTPPGLKKRKAVPAKKEDKPKNDDNDDDVVDEFDPKEQPQPRQTDDITSVKVFLTKGYWLGKYEVTQSEWKQLMKTEPWKGQKFTKEGADYPATFVSWDDAVDFGRNLTEQERQAGRLSNDWEYTLPTEAQWERACRARTETRFSFGDDESKLVDYAWFDENALNAGEEFAHRVGQKKANSWGLCDMHGNVSEWCRDVYTEKLPGGRDPEVESDEKTNGSIRALRGGNWLNDAAACRTGYRLWNQPGVRDGFMGFRPALSPVRPDK